MFSIPNTKNFFVLQQYLPLAVLKQPLYWISSSPLINSLQQYLPLAVLKLEQYAQGKTICGVLQQYLPLAVLKQFLPVCFTGEINEQVATVLTACGIETGQRNQYRC